VPTAYENENKEQRDSRCKTDEEKASQASDKTYSCETDAAKRAKEQRDLRCKTDGEKASQASDKMENCENDAVKRTTDSLKLDKRDGHQPVKEYPLRSRFKDPKVNQVMSTPADQKTKNSSTAKSPGRKTDINKSASVNPMTPSHQEDGNQVNQCYGASKNGYDPNQWNGVSNRYCGEDQQHGEAYSNQWTTWNPLNWHPSIMYSYPPLPNNPFILAYPYNVLNNYWPIDQRIVYVLKLEPMFYCL